MSKSEQVVRDFSKAKKLLNILLVVFASGTIGYLGADKIGLTNWMSVKYDLLAAPLPSDATSTLPAARRVLDIPTPPEVVMPPIIEKQIEEIPRPDLTVNEPAFIEEAREEIPAFDEYLVELEEEASSDPTDNLDEQGYAMAQTCEVTVPKMTTKVLAFADERGCEIDVKPYINETMYCSSLLGQCVKIVI